MNDGQFVLLGAAISVLSGIMAFVVTEINVLRKRVQDLEEIVTIDEEDL